MTAIALELGDAGLLAVGPEGPLAEASPGYAVIDGAQVITGQEAVRRARLKPTLVHTRFWSELSTEPLGRPFPRGLSAADLVHAHLGDLWREIGETATSVILVVPGSSRGTDLGLVLGIARSCGIPVVGMVDAAVASARGVPVSGPLLHVDLELHRTVVTLLERDGDVIRSRVDVDSHTGLIALHDALARRIADLFVRETRFDPMHSADCEQALYRALPKWLRELENRPSVVATIPGHTDELAVELDRRQLLSSVGPDYQHIAEFVARCRRSGEEKAIVLTDHVHRLPGLVERLATVGKSNIIRLSAAAGGEGALACRDAIESPDENLPFVDRLPSVPHAAPASIAPATSPDEARRVEVPTHLLLDATVHLIPTAGLTLGIARGESGVDLRGNGPTDGISRIHCRIHRDRNRLFVEDLSRWGTFLNGDRVSGRMPLAVGDRLRIGSPGIELRLIRVAESSG